MMMTSGSSSRWKSTVASNPVLAHLADRRVGDVPDVALAALEPGYLGRVDVESQDRDSAVAEGSGQRQADVAQADDPDTHRRRFDLGQKFALKRSVQTRVGPRPTCFGKRIFNVSITGHSFGLDRMRSLSRESRWPLRCMIVLIHFMSTIIRLSLRAGADGTDHRAQRATQRVRPYDVAGPS